MARPPKKGIEYYPFDVDFLNNIKVRRILKGCGAGSIAVLLYLLGNIYKDEGYYMVWSEDVSFLIADNIGVTEGLVQETLNKALQVDIFNKDLFEKHSKLTSKRVQTRYFFATQKRVNDHVIDEYILVTDAETGISASETKVNASVSTQRKVNKRKLKETIKDNSAISVFEQAWSLYPLKRNKSAVNKQNIADIEKLGLESITFAINNYIKDVENKRKSGFTELKYVNGSTFFNGRYKDYLNSDSVIPETKSVFKKNAFHNFKGQSDDYTEEQLNEIVEKKRIVKSKLPDFKGKLNDYTVKELQDMANNVVIEEAGRI